MFIISLIGILILLFIINNSQPKITEISSINQKHLNKQIKIIGQISEIKNYENNFITFKISDSTGKIIGICNCPNIQENQTLKIIGKIQKYKYQLQIQVEKIIST